MVMEGKKEVELVEEPVAQTPPHLEPHRALLRQWAQDKAIERATV